MDGINWNLWTKNHGFSKLYILKPLFRSGRSQANVWRRSYLQCFFPWKKIRAEVIMAMAGVASGNDCYSLVPSGYVKIAIENGHL
jgi:ribosomal protein L32E